MYSGTDVNVTTAGCPYLGAAIGSFTFIQEFEVASWSEKIIQLAKFARYSHMLPIQLLPMAYPVIGYIYVTQYPTFHSFYSL